MSKGEQLSLLDLLESGDDERRKAEFCQRHWEWLLDVRKVDAHECRHLFERMVDELGAMEAFERSKCLDALSGELRVTGWRISDVDVLGLFDPAIDYHTCWDRAHAAREGWGKEKVAELVEWDWGGKGGHVFKEAA